MSDMIASARRAGGGRRLGLAFCLICVLSPGPAAAQDAVKKEVEGLPPAPVASTDIITRIEFFGNRVTQPQIMLQEMVVKEGDIADAARIEQSRQAIMNLGLFISVRAKLEPAANGVVLRIVVKEKIYILPVPKLDRDDDNNISLGAELSFDNLAGLNQKLKLRYSNEDAQTVSEKKITTSLVSFSYPRVFGSRWLLHSELTQVYSPAEVMVGTTYDPESTPTDDSLYKKKAWTMAVQASRWLDPLGLSRGWQLGSGLVWRHNSYDFVAGKQTSVFQDSQAVGVSLLGQYFDVRDYLFSRSGKEYGYTGEFGTRTLGSDTSYTRHEFFHRTYLLLDGRPHENIDIQGRLGLSSGDLFPGEGYAYSLGGSKTLRGYKTGSSPGNSYLLFNVQYLRPFFKYYPFRGALFLDVGNAYPSNTEMHLGKVKWDVGIGFRLRLKSFVKLDLRVDAAYAYDSGDRNGELKYFFGTKEIF
jgi:outer membrane protein assembly factor BamA